MLNSENIRNIILQGDALEKLKTIPDESVNCILSSPAYYCLRDYQTATWDGGDLNCDHNPQRPDGGQRHNRSLPPGRGGMYKSVCAKCGAIRVDKQLGIESTPMEYIDRLVEIFREAKRVLRDDGCFFLNLGDSYNGSGGAGGDYNKGGFREGQPKFKGANMNGLAPKNLLMIPARVAIALQDDGWILRNDIIWEKGNPLPESVKDRFTKSHEHVFFFVKSRTNYFDADAVAEPSVTYDVTYDHDKREPAIVRNRLFNYDSKINKMRNISGNMSGNGVGRTTEGLCLKTKEEKTRPMRNKRDVWNINTTPYRGAHYAPMPEELATICILAGCPEEGLVLDPFFGAGTTGVAAKKNRRDYLGIELNPDYIELATKRIKNVAYQTNFVNDFKEDTHD